MGTKTLIAATRGSRLALTQTDEALAAIRQALPGVNIDKHVAETPGDRDLQIDLGNPSVPDDFFTRDLDEALLAGRADIAIHSAKDLPKIQRKGLVVAALLPARETRDALVIRQGIPRDRIRSIGTSSPKREAEIRALFPDATTRPLRGPVDGRLVKLDAGEYDAIVVAACALDRLGLGNRVNEYLPYDAAPQQGRLAVTARATDKALVRALKKLDVRQKSGMVAIMKCFRGETPPPEAKILHRMADTIAADPGPQCKCPRDVAPTAQEARRQALLAAERGDLVVRLVHNPENIPAEIEFFRSWSVRFETIPPVQDAALRCPWTLFTGLDPENFLRHGPLLHVPLIEIAGRPLEERKAWLAANLPSARGVIVPSRPSVDMFCEALEALGGKAVLEDKIVIALGPFTASELRDKGIAPTRAPEDFGGIASLIGNLSGLSGRFLYPCSDQAPFQKRIDAMKEIGIDLSPNVFYENRPTCPAALPAEPYDRVLFTSPSTVSRYFESFPSERAAARTWLAIGPATEQALEDLDLDAIRIDR